MHSATFTRAIALSCLIALSSPGAQDTTQSLGELARKERERKKALTQTSNEIQNLKLSPQEEKAYLQVGFTTAEERTCKAGLGRYADWEQLFAGCRAQGVTLATDRQDDPRRDPNYDYRLSVSANAFELSAAPRRSGLGGFFSDGQKIYFNPQGAATRESKAIYDFVSAAAAPSAGTAVQGKKVYTEEDLQGLGGQINTGGGGTSAAGDTAPAPGHYKPAEEVALNFSYCFMSLEGACKVFLERRCSFEELIAGVEVRPGHVRGFIKDPRDDPNYEYTLTINGDDYEIAASPKRPGLGGFYSFGPDIHFNPDGPASRSDRPVFDTVDVYKLNYIK